MELNNGKLRSRTNSTVTTQGIKFKLGDDTGLELDDHLHKDKHTLFCEMTELKLNKKRGAGGEPEWRETARWVKFEEDVEEGGNRWSKPFVASLSLHSLLELRNHFTTGMILLDLDASNLHELWTEVIQQWVDNKCLEEEYRDAVLGTLLLRPKHLNQRRMRKVNSKDPDNTKARSFSQLLRNSSSNLLDRNDNSKDSAANLEGLSREESRANLHFLKKLPSGTEAANILVAELDFLPPVPLTAFVRLSRPTFLGSLTEVPVPTRYLFVLLGPRAMGDRYHQIGRTMGTLFSDELFQQVIYKAKDREDILSAMDDFLGASTVLPPGEWDPKIRIEPPACVQSQEARIIDKLKRTASSDILELEGLNASGHGKSDHGAGIRRTGRLFGGFVDDIKRKMPFYVSDFRDAIHIQCLASFIFLYFASMTPLITFGGLMSDLLKRRMGAVETILARSLSGVVWGFTAGQPMVILGSTGPILVFEVISFNMCESMGIDYLPMRLWIGIWSTILLLLMVVFDLSSLVSYITRFTEESFAALVSAIFVYEAFKKLIHIAEEEPLRTHPGIISNTSDVCDCVMNSPVINRSVHIPISQNFSKEDCINAKNLTTDVSISFFGDGCTHYIPDAFLLSVVLFFGTYAVARTLKDFKVSPFFTNKLRQFVSDFAVIISIGIFVGLDYALGIPSPKLSVPEQLEPTYEPREGSWIVPFFGKNEWWTAIAALLPGILVTILIFMDQQITTVIINRKENRFRKKMGYHLDLFVVALLTLVMSFLGMPWMVADTVLSLTHVASLRMESEVAAPGERPTFLGVREQRVTNIVISIVIGVSIFMTSFLKIIPMPVLFGVFLFMGLNALNGLQFTDRLKLVFMPLKYQPDYAYLRHVKIKRVHVYTFIQLLCLIILWVLKSFLETAMLFPLMVGALVGVRKLMDHVFTQYELSFLDDIMPENVKRKKEDRQKNEQKEALPANPEDDCMKIRLPNGNVLSVPVKKNHSSVSHSSDALDFTSAMNKTGLWKNISSANLLSQVNEMEEYKSRDTMDALELPKTRKRRRESTRPGDQDGLSPVPDAGSDVESDPMLQMDVPPYSDIKSYRST